MASIYDLVGLI